MIGIQYKESVPSKTDYFVLFETTGWNEKYQFSAEDLEKAIRDSWFQVSAYDKNKLVGFGRILSDGTHHALIVDLMVHPYYQKKGIGKEILKRLVEKCQQNNIKDIQLFSAKGKAGFYEKYGFERRAADAPGMQFIQNQDPIKK